MKTFFIAILMLPACKSFCQVNNEADVSSTVTVQKISGRVHANPVNTQWQKDAENYVAATEYYFKTDGDENMFYAANRAQRLGFSINALGYKVSPAASSIKSS